MHAMPRCLRSGAPFLLLLLAGCGGSSPPRVVLYCAQDQEFAEGLLADFHRETGLDVATKFDTEKGKSVVLYQELVEEKSRPRCDVFWNNEILSTLRLQKQGLLEAYDSPQRAAFPAWARATDHTWTAFAQRARVLLVNSKQLDGKAPPESLLDLTDARFRGRVVMAKPLHGTSVTQAVALFEVLGPKKAREYYLALKANGVQIAPGNKQVAEWVAAGRTPRGDPVAVGITDTDDAFAEVHPGGHVTIISPDAKRAASERLGTLFIPNTLAILKGGPNPIGAQRLVDFLLRPEVEKKLAEGESRQIPVNPAVVVSLPPEIPTPKTVHPMQVDWPKAADLWDEAVDFLRQEFAGS
jgi:iron(III) transport system substrate-binding protein